MTNTTEYPLKRTTVRASEKYRSIQQCLIALGARERDVYYTHRREEYTKKLGGGKDRSIWDEFDEEFLLNWVHEMYWYSAKMYRHNEEALKEINIARDRALEIIYNHYHLFERG